MLPTHAQYGDPEVNGLIFVEDEAKVVTTSKRGEFWRLLHNNGGKNSRKIRACSTADNAVSDWVEVVLQLQLSKMAMVRQDLVLRARTRDELDFVCRVDYEALLMVDGTETATTEQVHSFSFFSERRSFSCCCLDREELYRSFSLFEVYDLSRCYFEVSKRSTRY